MNREIKFRVWNIGEKSFFGSDLRDYINYYNQVCAPDSIIVMQYIGVKDINGKEIYEGDIVTYGQLSSTQKGEELYEVVYCAKHNFPSYGFRSLSKNIIIPRIEMTKITTIGDDPNGTHVGIVTGVEHSGIKVVGNIYENPDLLEWN